MTRRSRSRRSRTRRPGPTTRCLRVTDSHGASTTSAPITITVTSGSDLDVRDDDPGSSTDTASRRTTRRFRSSPLRRRERVKVTGYISGLGHDDRVADRSGGHLCRFGRQPRRAAGRLERGDDQREAGLGLGRLHLPVARSGSRPERSGSGTSQARPSNLTQLRYDSAADDLRYNQTDGYAAGASNPFGYGVNASIHYSLYATYG